VHSIQSCHYRDCTLTLRLNSIQFLRTALFWALTQRVIFFAVEAWNLAIQLFTYVLSQQPNGQLQKKTGNTVKYNTYTKTRNTRNITHNQDTTTIIIIIIPSKHNTNFSQSAISMHSRCFYNTIIVTGSSPSHHFLHTKRSENIKQGIRYCTRLTIHDRFQPYQYRRDINSNASILSYTSYSEKCIKIR
jgi:hypothetical protein